MKMRMSPDIFVGRVAVVFLTIALPVFFQTTSYAARDDFFLRQRIDVAGTILGFRAADFNGDGKTDIALLVAEPSDRRVLQVYLQRESDRFPPSPGQSLTLSSSVNMIQSLDIDGDGRAELFTIDHDGLRQYNHDGKSFIDKPKAQVPGSTVFTGAIEGGILPDEFIHNISDRWIVFLPIDEGFLLWEYRQGEFQQLGKINFPHVIYKNDRPVKYLGNPMCVFAMTLPKIVIDEREGKSDIYLIWPDRLAIFPAAENGRFDNGESVHFRFQEAAAGNFCQSRLVDFDLDGRLDLVCSQSTGGISGAHTDIKLFGSDRFRHANITESHKIALTDVCGNLMIDNFDRVGGLELVVPAIELGTMSAVKMMITKNIDCHLLIYPIDNLGRPAREPKVRRKMTCRLDFEKADPTEDIRIDWSGDYDGDGLPDLVLADGGGKLMFYRGSSEEYLEDKAEIVLDISGPDIVHPVHLNADGRSDLIIIQQPGRQSARLTLLVTNRIS